MTVKELIWRLQYMDGDMEVAFRVPAKDYVQTQLAFGANHADEKWISFSHNHGEDVIVDPESEFFEKDKARLVVLIDT
jgi:hypothetical protein